MLARPIRSNLDGFLLLRHILFPSMQNKLVSLGLISADVLHSPLSVGRSKSETEMVYSICVD